LGILGFLDKKTTVTDMQFINISEADISIKSAKKNSMFISENLRAFNFNFWQWQHEYRTRYTIDFLERYGYDIEQSGTYYGIDKDKAEDYLNNNITDFKESKQVYVQTPSIETTFYWYLDNTDDHDWSNKEHELYEDGETWTMFSVDYVDDTKEDIVASFHCESDTNKPDKTIETDNTFKDTLSFIASYYTNAGGDEWYYYIEDVTTIDQDILTENTLETTAIVPLKIDNKLVGEGDDQEEKAHTLNKMMRKLNLSADDFEETLTQKDEDDEDIIDNAYLINGLSLVNPYIVEVKHYDAEDAQYLPVALMDLIIKEGEAGEEDDDGGKYNDRDFNVTDEIAEKWYNDHIKEEAYLARALFKTFAYYSGVINPDYIDKKPNYWLVEDCILDDIDGTDASSAFVSDSSLKFEYNFKIEVKKHHDDTVRPGETKKSQSKFFTEDDGTLVIQCQTTETVYQEMRITNYNSHFTISGHSFDLNVFDTALEHRIILPYFVMQKLRFREYCTAQEHSFCLIAYSIKTVVVKWYKRFAGVLIGAAMCLLGPGACTASMLIYNAVVGVATTLVMEYAMELIDSDIFKLVLNIGMSIYNMDFNGIYDLASLGENFLKLGPQVSKIMYNGYSQYQAIVGAEEKKEAIANENIDNKLSNYYESQGITAPMIMTQHHSFAEATSPDMIYAQMHSEHIYDYNQYFGFTDQLDRRLNVVAG